MRTYGSVLAGGLLAVLTLGGASLDAWAATQVFSGLDNQDLSAGGATPLATAARAAFTTAAGSVLVQTFDGTPAGAVPNLLATPFGVSINVSQADVHRIVTGPTTFGTYPTSGNFLELDAAPGRRYATVTFDAAASAFGFDITDASDWKNDPRDANNLVVTLFFSGRQQAIQLFAPTDPDTIENGTFGFFGVVSSDPILAFAITNPSTNLGRDRFGMDNFGYVAAPSSAVPLPAAGWLLLSGLMSGATRARRRRT